MNETQQVGPVRSFNRNSKGSINKEKLLYNMVINLTKSVSGLAMNISLDRVKKLTKTIMEIRDKLCLRWGYRKQDYFFSIFPPMLYDEQ